jgi:hypothetical protein
MKSSIFYDALSHAPPSLYSSAGTANRHRVSYPKRGCLSLGGRCIAFLSLRGFFTRPHVPLIRCVRSFYACEYIALSAWSFGVTQTAIGSVATLDTYISTLVYENGQVYVKAGERLSSPQRSMLKYMPLIQKKKKKKKKTYPFRQKDQANGKRQTTNGLGTSCPGQENASYRPQRPSLMTKGSRAIPRTCYLTLSTPLTIQPAIVRLT